MKKINYEYKGGKYYHTYSRELSPEEILDMLNLRTGNKVFEKPKLELEDKNIGKPTCPTVSIGQEEASEALPQAWKKE